MLYLKKIIFTLIHYPHRIRFGSNHPDSVVKDRVKTLKKQGYLVLEDFFSGDVLSEMQSKYKEQLETNCNFELPCLSQALIDDKKHDQLISDYFKCHSNDLVRHGITFSRSDFKDYKEAVEKYNPSTLTTYLTTIPDFFKYFLNEDLLAVIESYMGLRPHLTEAYIRRNFPAKYKVMNHCWHRDTNNPYYLLKAFIFISDCTITSGPHEYISGTINDKKLSGKTYYSDEEIDKAYPLNSCQRIQSIVKAGTVIIEDTRGLHRATIPENGYRDLAFAVFLPESIIRKSKNKYYGIPLDFFNKLSKLQKAYVPKKCIM